MAYNYASLQAKIVTKVAKFGTVGTLLSSTTTPTDPSEPWKGNAAGTSIPVKVIMASLTESDLKSFNMADEIGDQKKAIIAVEAGVDPLPDDVLTVDGTPWRLIRGKKVAPGGINLIYIFVVKK